MSKSLEESACGPTSLQQNQFVPDHDESMEEQQLGVNEDSIPVHLEDLQVNSEDFWTEQNLGLSDR